MLSIFKKKEKEPEIIEGEVVEEKDDQYLFGCKSAEEEAGYIMGYSASIHRDE